MVGRGEITDKAWEAIAPLLPENGQRGGQWQDHRRVVNGILWKLRTDAPWRDLPESATTRGKPATTGLCAGGARAPGIGWFPTKADQVVGCGGRGGEWEVSVDSSVARAHQHAAGARKNRSRADAKKR